MIRISTPRLLPLLAFLVLSACSASSEAQLGCAGGRPCGDTCIDVDQTCDGESTGAPPTRTRLSSTTQIPPAGARYVASVRGSVYYPIACEAWHSLRSELIWFTSEEEAKAAALRPTTNWSCRRAQTEGLHTTLTDTCTIERVIDGDTVACREANERIRLLLLDAPELSQGEFGTLAREALEQILPLDLPALVEFDVQKRDRYGRILAYLYAADGTMANEEMVRRGFAVVSVYPPNVRHVELMRTAAEEARVNRRGLWSSSAFECVPADYRAGRCE